MPAQTEVTDAPSLTAMFHGTAAYVDRILKGAKPSQIIVHENQTNAFAIVDLKSGDVVAGESMARPRLSLSEVEDWYIAQNFVAKIASDGTCMRDVSPVTTSRPHYLRRCW